MAGESREKRYENQLRELGVYEPAFDAAIHDLCIMERELSRTMKAWKATAAPKQAPLTTDPLYAQIQAQRKEINAVREALGLTPRGLQKLRGRPKGDEGVAGAEICRRLDAIWEKVNSYE